MRATHSFHVTYRQTRFNGLEEERNGGFAVGPGEKGTYNVGLGSGFSFSPYPSFATRLLPLPPS